MRSVMSPKRRSTWFSQELLVGVKWKWKRCRFFGFNHLSQPAQIYWIATVTLACVGVAPIEMTSGTEGPDGASLGI